MINEDEYREGLRIYCESRGGEYRTEERGVRDIFIASIDRLKGFPEAIETVYPDAAVTL